MSIFFRPAFSSGLPVSFSTNSFSTPTPTPREFGWIGKSSFVMLPNARWIIPPRNINGALNPPHSVSSRLASVNFFSFVLFLFIYFCRDCRVVRDPQTLKSKGYGFVSFVKKSVSDPSLLYVSLLSCLYSFLLTGAGRVSFYFYFDWDWMEEERLSAETPLVRSHFPKN